MAAINLDFLTQPVSVKAGFIYKGPKPQKVTGGVLVGTCAGDMYHNASALTGPVWVLNATNGQIIASADSGYVSPGNAVLTPPFGWSIASNYTIGVGGGAGSAVFPYGLPGFGKGEDDSNDGADAMGDLRNYSGVAPLITSLPTTDGGSIGISALNHAIKNDHIHVEPTVTAAQLGGFDFSLFTIVSVGPGSLRSFELPNGTTVYTGDPNIWGTVWSFSGGLSQNVEPLYALADGNGTYTPASTTPVSWVQVNPGHPVPPADDADIYGRYETCGWVYRLTANGLIVWVKRIGGPVSNGGHGAPSYVTNPYGLLPVTKTTKR